MYEPLLLPFRLSTHRIYHELPSQSAKSCIYMLALIYLVRALSQLHNLPAEYASSHVSEMPPSSHLLSNFFPLSTSYASLGAIVA